MIEMIDKQCPVVSRETIQDDIKYLEMISRKVILRELKGKHFSLTADHWILPNDETYSCCAAHWVENAKMCCTMLVFEVFHGTSTTGVELRKDFERVVLNIK
jgi:hypothetical protein